MPRDPNESLDDFLGRRRNARRATRNPEPGTRNPGDGKVNVALLVIVAGSAVLAIYHSGWVRVGLLGIVPAFGLLGLCSVIYRLRALRIIVAPIGVLILLGFPALWTDSVVYALTDSWTLSTGVAIVVVFVTVPALVAFQRWAKGRRQDRSRLEEDAPE